MRDFLSNAIYISSIPQVQDFIRHLKLESSKSDFEVLHKEIELWVAEETPILVFLKTGSWCGKYAGRTVIFIDDSSRELLEWVYGKVNEPIPTLMKILA